jgi:sulfide:quinone oxidoreductase
MNASRTLILGGGFGGISTANALRRQLPREHEITVIDHSPRFEVSGGKIWVMLGERSAEQISRARSEMLAPGVKLSISRAKRLNIQRRTVETESGGSLTWDYLVIALGAELDMAAVPGLAEAATTFYTTEGALGLKKRLDHFTGGDIAVLVPTTPFACPPAPYEAAFTVQHFIEQRGLSPKVNLTIYTVEPTPMPTAGTAMGHYLEALLKDSGIGFVPGKKVSRVDSEAELIKFDDASEANFDLLIAIPPHKAPALVREAGLIDATGWIPVHPQTLEVESTPRHRRVYALGDVAALPLPGRYHPDVPLFLPKGGVFAEAQGTIVAHQIAATILDRKPSETFTGTGECFVQIGGGNAIKADGAFFETPHPVIQKHAPSEAQLRAKEEWVDRHLQPF